MEFYNEVMLEGPQAEAMARGLFAVAKVDGVHAREAALVASFFHDAGGGAQALAELERRPSITGEELAAALPETGQRLLFMKTAILLSWADGQVTSAEKEILASFAAALKVDPATVAHLETAVKEYLLAHLSHIQNVEATSSVAKKLMM